MSFQCWRNEISSISSVSQAAICGNPNSQLIIVWCDLLIDWDTILWSQHWKWTIVWLFRDWYQLFQRLCDMAKFRANLPQIRIDHYDSYYQVNISPLPSIATTVKQHSFLFSFLLILLFLSFFWSKHNLIGLYLIAVLLQLQLSWGHSLLLRWLSRWIDL